MRMLLLVAALGCGGNPKRVLPPEHDAPAEPPHTPETVADDGTLGTLEHGDRVVTRLTLKHHVIEKTLIVGRRHADEGELGRAKRE